MPLSCEASPTVLNGSAAALFICGFEVPIEKVELKRSAKKTEITSSASYFNGVLWEEYSPGASGGSLSFDSKWRIQMAVSPPSIRAGAIYPVALYTRRPLTLGPGDQGSAFALNLFIDDNSITVDPRQGVIDWKVSGTVTGPIIDPA